MVRQRQPRAVKLVIIFVALTVFVLGACGDRISEVHKKNLSIIPSQAAIKPGGRQRFHVCVSVEGEISPTGTFQWTSNDPKIASVSAGGVATGLQEGTTSISSAGSDPVVEAILEVKASAPRPVEILDVTPLENEIVPRSCPACQCLQSFTPQIAVSADFNFPGEDFFHSARLFIDGGEVTADSLVEVSRVSTAQFADLEIEGSIRYGRLLELPLGSHQVTVEAKSREGKTVTYTWSFTLTE